MAGKIDASSEVNDQWRICFVWREDADDDCQSKSCAPHVTSSDTLRGQTPSPTASKLYPARWIPYFVIFF